MLQPKEKEKEYTLFCFMFPPKTMKNFIEANEHNCVVLKWTDDIYDG
jgi:hypothetical protein